MKSRLHIRHLILMAMAILALASCKKEPQPEEEKPKKAEYTLFYNAPDRLGYIVNIILLEYNVLGEVVNSTYLAEVRDGTKKTFVANELAIKVKAYIITEHKTTEREWVHQVFYLKAGENVLIEVNPYTVVSKIEP